MKSMHPLRATLVLGVSVLGLLAAMLVMPRQSHAAMPVARPAAAKVGITFRVDGCTVTVGNNDAGSISYTAYIKRDTNHCGVRAAAHCENIIGFHDTWAHGGIRTTAPSQSKAVCSAFKLWSLDHWGIDIRKKPGKPWSYHQIS